jgi:hypothetical protein
LATVDFFEDLSPSVCVCARFEIAREQIDPHVTLFVLVGVAGYAMLLKEGLQGFLSVGRRGLAQEHRCRRFD